MLEAKPVSLFSRDFDISTDGQKIALLDISFLREAGEVTIAGRPYKLYREGLWSGAFVLEGGERIIARAVKPSVFLSRFELEIDGHRYSLRRTSLFAKAFSVFQDEAVVGSVRRAGLFTRRAIIDLPSEWPIPVQVFAFWLVSIIWRRHRRHS
jgi:hypothetical protein